MPDDLLDVEISLVNTNNRALLHACLASIPEACAGLNWLNWALSILAIVAVGLATLATKLLDYPGAQADEPLYTDPGASLAAGTGFASPIQAGLQQGVDRHFYWQVPVYPLALAGWLRVFGFGLLQVRAFSVACGILTAILVFLIVRRHAPAWSAVAAGLVVEVSGWVVISSRIGRPEIAAVCLVAAACLAHDIGRSRRSMRFVAGFLAGLAACTHPIGSIAFLAIGLDLILQHGWAAVRDRGALLVAAGFGLVIAAWGLWILQAPADFWAQFALFLNVKKGEAVFSVGGHWAWVQLRLPGLAVLVGAAVWLGRQSLRVPAERFWMLVAGVALVVAVLGRDSNYLVYTIPPLAVCLGIAAWRLDRKWLAGAAFAVVLGNEGAITAYHIINTPVDQESKARAALLAAVPPGKSVFIFRGGEFGYYALQGRNPLLMYAWTVNPAGIAQTGVRETALVATKDYLIQGPHPDWPDLADFTRDLKPVAVIHPGPGYYLLVYRLN